VEADVATQIQSLDEQVRLLRFADAVLRAEESGAAQKAAQHMLARVQGLEGALLQLQSVVRTLYLDHAAEAGAPQASGSARERRQPERLRDAAIAAQQSGLGSVLGFHVLRSAMTHIAELANNPPLAHCRAANALTIAEAESRKFEFSEREPFLLARGPDGVCVLRATDGSCTRCADPPLACLLACPRGNRGNVRVPAALQGGTDGRAQPE
jgi:hypothetical protein